METTIFYDLHSLDAFTNAVFKNQEFKNLHDFGIRFQSPKKKFVQSSTTDFDFNRGLKNALVEE